MAVQAKNCFVSTIDNQVVSHHHFRSMLAARAVFDRVNDWKIGHTPLLSSGSCAAPDCDKEPQIDLSMPGEETPSE